MASLAEQYTHHAHAAQQDAEQHVDPFTEQTALIIRRAWKTAARNLEAVRAAADWNLPSADQLVSQQEIEEQLRDPVNKLHTQVYKTMLHGTLGVMDIGFDVKNPIVEGAFRQLGGRITMISQDERERIMAHLDKGWQEGESIENLARGMRNFADGFSMSRAALIARTEFAAAVNGASVAGARIGGVAAYKTWLATEDAHTRDTHAEADGQAVPIDSTFTVGDSQLAYPGDPSAPPEEICNCRCTCLFGDDATGEETGNDFSASADPESGYSVEQRFAKGAVVGARDSMLTGRMTRVWREISAAGGEQAPLRWQAELAYGDTWTTDGRYLAKDGAQLPAGNWPFMSMLMDDHGTGGPFGGGMTSFAAGHGDKVWWDGNVLMGEGSFNSQDAGLAAAQSIEDGDVVGISIDTFPLEWEISVPVSEDDLMFFRRKVAQLSADEIVALVRKGVFTPTKLRAHLAAEADNAESDDSEPADDVITIRESVDDFPKMQFLKWQFLGATQVPFPAFDAAHIAMLEADRIAASGMPSASGSGSVTATDKHDDTVLTASAAGLAPLAAPSEWFDVPEADSYQALTVTAEGQVFGHVARWGECHTAYGISVAQGQSCVRAPQSHSRYAYYMAGHYLTEDDRDVAVGIISLADSHAGLGKSADEVREHYEDSAAQAAYVTAVDGKHGIWVCGTVAPHLSAEKVVQLRAAKPSGDWRMINRHLELLGVLAVNVPGFPVPRARLVAGATQEDPPELVALVAAGYPDAALSGDERRARALRIAEGRAGLLSALDAV